MATLINLNNTVPAPLANGQNVLWQNDASSPTNVSAYLALGGVSTNVQVNISGSLYGDSGFTYDGTVVKAVHNSVSGLVLTFTSATAAISSFVLSAAANAVGNFTTYTGTFNPNLVMTDRNVVVTGFVNAGNNGIGFQLVSITATTLVLENPNGVSETHAGTATLEFPVTLYAGAIPTAAQGGANYAKITVAGFSNAGNNGTFSCVGANASWITVKNSGGVLETHAGTGTFATTVPVGGNVIVQGNNLNPLYQFGPTGSWNPLAPLFNFVGGSNSGFNFVLSQDGNPNDSAMFDIYQDPDGNHGFQLGVCGRADGLYPMFLEMTVNPAGGFSGAGLLCPDETSGISITGTPAVPTAGYNSSVVLTAGTGLSPSSFLNSPVPNATVNVTLDGTLGFSVNAPFILTQATPTTTAGQVGFGTTTSTSANAGANGDVPGQVVGYLSIDIAGTKRKIPYYAI